MFIRFRQIRSIAVVLGLSLSTVVVIASRLLSGYLTTVSGREYAFSVFVNGAGSWANPAIDRLVEGFVLGWAP